MVTKGAPYFVVFWIKNLSKWPFYHYKKKIWAGFSFMKKVYLRSFFFPLVFKVPPAVRWGYLGGVTPLRWGFLGGETPLRWHVLTNNTVFCVQQKWCYFWPRGYIKNYHVVLKTFLMGTRLATKIIFFFLRSWQFYSWITFIPVSVVQRKNSCFFFKSHWWWWF